MLCAPAPPALRATATCTRSHSRARACREPAPSAQRCATARPPPAPPLPCCGRCAPLGARRRLSLARQTATTATARRTAGWRLLARVEPSSGGHRTASTSPTLVGLARRMDPSVLFVGACVLSPPFLAAHHAQGNMWHEARRYFGHPLVAAALGVTLLLAAWGARVGARCVRPGGRFPSHAFSVHPK